MVDLSSLNPEQHEAATSFKGPTLILAGAGTGKTRVITYRIAHMIAEGVDPDEIVALSFTNKAAKEMSTRVKELIGKKSENVWMSTFHSFCLSILRRFPKEAGLAKQFSIIDSSDQIDLVRKALDEKGWGGVARPDELHAKISKAKNALISPEALLDDKFAEEYGDDLAFLAETYDLYERGLALNRAIDFDDCIFKAVRLLQNNEDIREKLKARHRYLLVDEFQDTNFSQLMILELLAGKDHNICVVGDDDQSIYSWRGAMYETLERFEEMFPKTLVTKLEQNYRCTNVVLHAANTVIKNNSKRKKKTLWSDSTNKTPITLSAHERESFEAGGVAEQVMTLLGQGAKPSDMAVLYRTNAQARHFELAFRETRINYKTFGGQSFFERKEVKDFFAYLRLVKNNFDRIPLWRVINTPSRGVGLKTLEAIDAAAKGGGQPFGIITKKSVPLGKRQTASLDDFVKTIQRLSALPLNTAKDFEDLGHKILDDFRLVDDIKLRTKDPRVKDRKIANLKALPNLLKTVASELLEKTGKLNSTDLIDSLTLGAEKKDEEDLDNNYVSLMTIHSAKGLEFPVVFVVGLEEELLPHKNSLESAQSLCEERRLFYVALTRSKHRLFLSYCLERTYGGGNNERSPSRFLDELPKESFSEDGVDALVKDPKKRKKKRQEKTLSKLSAIKSSLASGKW